MRTLLGPDRHGSTDCVRREDQSFHMRHAGRQVLFFVCLQRMPRMLSLVCRGCSLTHLDALSGVVPHACTALTH